MGCWCANIFFLEKSVFLSPASTWEVAGPDAAVPRHERRPPGGDGPGRIAVDRPGPVCHREVLRTAVRGLVCWVGEMLASLVSGRKGLHRVHLRR